MERKSQESLSDIGGSTILNKKIFETEALLPKDIESPVKHSHVGPTKHSATVVMQRSYDDVIYYENIFEKLKAETGIKDIDELIHMFKTIDQINTELYQKAN